VRRSAFTLVELLVVIAVIAILAGISFPVMSSVKTRQKAKATKLFIEDLKLKIEQYANDFGDYPPSTAKWVGLPSNGTNDGIECLVRCLTTKKKKGPYYEFADEVLKNGDEDRIGSGNPTDSTLSTRELFECVDAFGNPFVYLHNADYETGHKVRSGDDTYKVKGQKSKKTGQHYNLRGFQLYSFGPNGKDDGGEEDDVTSWSTGE
jgi:prepilin-type N-terminal cleavage/methylation domain-containing protein